MAREESLDTTFYVHPLYSHGMRTSCQRQKEERRTTVSATLSNDLYGVGKRLTLSPPYLAFAPRSIINNVLNVFRPKRWVLTMVADKAGLDTITENPFDVEKVGCLKFGDYFVL